MYDGNGGEMKGKGEIDDDLRWKMVGFKWGMKQKMKALREHKHFDLGAWRWFEYVKKFI